MCTPLKSLYTQWLRFPVGCGRGRSRLAAGARFCEGALIAGNRALVEHVIRFVQAHDLLIKNAERA
jgi:hypothetical protein